MKVIKKFLKNKVIRFIFKFIEYILFGCIFLYLSFIAIQKISNNSSVFKYRMFTVVTGSMKPVYNVGDVIIIKETPFSDLKVGDDITYVGIKNETKDIIITHRIINIEEDRIFTKGTANTVEDPSITYPQVYGKVISKLYIITFISNLVRNQYGFFFLIFAPLVILVFMEIIDIFKGDKEGDKSEK